MRALAILVALAACNSLSPPPQPNDGAHPIANPGVGSSYPVGSTVTLDGSQSFDPQGAIASYHWEVGDHPASSTAQPTNADDATTTLVLDQFGTYRVKLTVTDAVGNTDTAEIKLVSTGAIQSIDAGAPTNVAWLATAQLAGTATVAAGQQATYTWTFLSTPAGSTATIENPSSLTPQFVADATGSYVLALDAAVGEEILEDTVTVEATAMGVTIGTGAVYAYATTTDRVLYAGDVGHAELVSVDPATGAGQVANLGAFVPKAIALDRPGTTVAVGGSELFTSEVVTALVATLAITGDRSLGNNPADQLVLPSAGRVDCFRSNWVDAVDMIAGQDLGASQPAEKPVVATVSGELFMLDAATTDLYRVRNGSNPPGQVIEHTSVPGLKPPLIGLGTSLPYVLAGNGYALDATGTLRYDLQIDVSTAVQNPDASELAVVSGTAVRVYTMMSGTPTLVFSAVVPNGSATKLIAYSADGHRLILVADDKAYTVPR